MIFFLYRVQLNTLFLRRCQNWSLQRRRILIKWWGHDFKIIITIIGVPGIAFNARGGQKESGVSIKAYHHTFYMLHQTYVW